MDGEPQDDPSAVTVGPSGEGRGAPPRPAPFVKPRPWEAPTVLGDATLGAPRPAGDLLGRYPITGHLGEGSMGEVLQVQDPDLGRQMAAKVMRGGSGAGDQGKLARFVQEAQITGQLEHPSIVPLHELGMTQDGQVYFTMKRVEGRTLAELIEAERAPAGPTGQKALLRWLDIFGKICDALRFAHSRGVIHRDLKPANVMVGAFGEVQVVDWGLARLVGQRDPVAASWQLDLGRGPIAELAGGGGGALRTQDGAVVGTPAYMPPESASSGNCSCSGAPEASSKATSSRGRGRGRVDAPPSGDTIWTNAVLGSRTQPGASSPSGVLGPRGG